MELAGEVNASATRGDGGWGPASVKPPPSASELASSAGYSRSQRRARVVRVGRRVRISTSAVLTVKSAPKFRSSSSVWSTRPPGEGGGPAKSGVVGDSSPSPYRPGSTPLASVRRRAGRADGSGSGSPLASAAPLASRAAARAGRGAPRSTSSRSGATRRGPARRRPAGAGRAAGASRARRPVPAPR